MLSYFQIVGICRWKNRYRIFPDSGSGDLGCGYGGKFEIPWSPAGSKLFIRPIIKQFIKELEAADSSPIIRPSASLNAAETL